jgi:small redox-active disulfide protein 2
MTIQILGGGCPNCRQLEENTRAALRALDIDATVEKVTDTDAIVEMGALMTPAIAVNGDVKKAGSVLSVDEIVAILSS